MFLLNNNKIIIILISIIKYYLFSINNYINKTIRAKKSNNIR